MNIILASGSPRRRELMELAGYDFKIEVSEADEDVDGLAPVDMVEELAGRKAGAVVEKHLIKGENCLIIAADTIVAMDGDILGKPVDEQDAFDMLKELSGNIHQVYTGVSLCLIEDGSIKASNTFHECTDVVFRELDDKEIHAYVATKEPLDKAGAYGIQGKAGIFVSKINGDYYNVVGLPICRVVTEIRKILADEED